MLSSKMMKKNVLEIGMNPVHVIGMNPADFLYQVIPGHMESAEKADNVCRLFIQVLLC